MDRTVSPLDLQPPPGDIPTHISDITAAYVAYDQLGRTNGTLRPDLVLADDAHQRIYVVRHSPPPCAAYVSYDTHGMVLPKYFFGTVFDEMNRIDSRIEAYLREVDRVNASRRPGNAGGGEQEDLCPVVGHGVVAKWRQDDSEGLRTLGSSRVAWTWAGWMVAAPVWLPVLVPSGEYPDCPLAPPLFAQEPAEFWASQAFLQTPLCRLPPGGRVLISVRL